MLCPSCSAEHESEQCSNAAATNSFGLLVPEVESDQPNLEEELELADSTTATQVSRLIEFPGISRRTVPEWRKELSARVREVQERRAREAAAEAEEAARLQAELPESAPPQLELLPRAEEPEVNPVVAAALRRLERAHQSSTATTYSRAATAVAVAPNQQAETDFVAEAVPVPAMEAPMPSESAPIPERTHNLVVVQAPVARLPEPEPPIETQAQASAA